jgi:hypothetical protein
MLFRALAEAKAISMYAMELGRLVRTEDAVVMTR